MLHMPPGRAIPQGQRYALHRRQLLRRAVYAIPAEGVVEEGWIVAARDPENPRRSLQAIEACHGHALGRRIDRSAGRPSRPR